MTTPRQLRQDEAESGGPCRTRTYDLLIKREEDVPRGTKACASPVLDNPDLLTIEDAATALGIEPKRLRGFIFRNGIADPIGDVTHVYGWSLKTLRERLSVIKGVAT